MEKTYWPNQSTTRKFTDELGREMYEVTIELRSSAGNEVKRFSAVAKDDVEAGHRAVNIMLEFLKNENDDLDNNVEPDEGR